MADILEVTDELRNHFHDWLNSEPRPKVVHDLAVQFPPWKLYRNKTAGDQRVTVIGYGEDGTLRVNVSGEYNLLVTGEREVFGIAPSDLEECDLPSPGEPLGDLFGTGLLDLIFNSQET